MSGHDEFGRVKSMPRIKRIPVIMLTSSREEVDLLKSYDGGVNRYPIRPVSFDDFLSAIKHIGKYWVSLNIEPPLDE